MTHNAIALDFALDYALLRGWPVFPCVPRSKVPATPHGFNDATLDADVIGKWWSTNPDFNVAIATGPPGPTVVDVDGEFGKRAWRELMDGTDWSNTPWASTGGEGWHIFFAPSDLRNSASKVAPHVDVRGRGGFVVAAPSVHPSGCLYWWQRSPDKRELAPVPSAVRDALRPRTVMRPVPAPRIMHERYARVALEREADRVAHAPVGSRNHALNVAAFSLGQLVGAGELDRAIAVNTLFNAGCAAGLTETEVLRTIASGLRAGADKPRQRR